MATTHDFRYANHSSLVILYPQTLPATAWVDDNLPWDRMEWAGGTVIEPRYLFDILDGIYGDGLTVEGGF